MGRLFLDANVFLYAVGGDSPHRESCRALLAAMAAGRIDAVTSSEVLQEVLHVSARRRGVADGIAATRAAAGLVAEVLPLKGPDVLAACEVLEEAPRLGARDAFHVAVMRAAGLTTMVSVDRDFDDVPGLTRVDPADAV